MDVKPHPLLLGYRLALARCHVITEHLTPDQFAFRTETHDSVGAHLRHCLDHQTSLLRGCHGALVEYDHRDRDPEFQNNPVCCWAALEKGWHELEPFAAENLDLELQVRLLAAPETEPIIVTSTLGRELSFLETHTIHHLAVVKILLDRLGVTVPQNLDLAYSTAAYQAALPKAPACAP